MNTNTRVSLVIPVYNEVEWIHDCLAAVAVQTVQPFEVIVVDNNSTDGTATIARTFPFVRVIHESRQGVVHARDTGFNAARGDIIARIDADTIVDPDWIQNVRAAFTDKSVDAVSGIVAYRNIAMPKLVNRIDLFWRRRMAHLLGSEMALQGANMAIRRTLWQRIASELCHESGIHEDFDIAIHTAKAGLGVRFDESLKVSVCYRQANYDFKSFSEYSLIAPRTYFRHGAKSGRYMYQPVLFVIVLYPIISALSRSYDKRTGGFSVAKLFSSGSAPRVNPATYVD